ncbi:Uncharacterised protein [Chlamydia trachomatis]|nr:Uncharacterised protein [Chlamydia trachomatis]
MIANISNQGRNQTWTAANTSIAEPIHIEMKSETENFKVRELTINDYCMGW